MGGLACATAIGAAVMPSAGWTPWLCFAAGFVGVLVLRGNHWRAAALLGTALALAIGLLDMFAEIFSPAAHGVGIEASFEPPEWLIADSDLGYRPRPGSRTLATSRYEKQLLFEVTYTITPEGMRANPPAPTKADTYLFMGDSFMFGQGLADDETLAAQFARANDFRVRALTFAAPGYAPNQLVRAFESGRFESLKAQGVKAVVVWIIPAQLERVTGDGAWLGSSPRYDFRSGAHDETPDFTGSFQHYRWRHPIAGLRHVAGQQFAFVAAIGERQHQEYQAELFIALMVRLQTLARDTFDAPLLVIYSWPDEGPPSAIIDDTAHPPTPTSLLAGLRGRGLHLLSVNTLTAGIEASKLLIPHDGHPTPLTNALIAHELGRRLIGQGPR